MARDQANIAGVLDLEGVASQKGGIIVATGDGEVAELAPGADGQTVVYDSTEPTGLRVTDSDPAAVRTVAAAKLFANTHMGG